jgi:ACT domain-containing protein
MKIDVNVQIHLDQREAPRWAQTLREMVSQVLSNQEKMIMPTIDELQAKAEATLAAVTAETDLNNAIAAVVNDQRATIVDLKAQLAAAGTDPAKLQALSDTMDAILAADTANDKIVTDAITANTPSA